jgi:hypothetical protein
MTILLWIDAGLAVLGTVILIMGLSGSDSGTSEDRMGKAFVAVFGAALAAAAVILFVILTAIKAWS